MDGGEMKINRELRTAAGLLFILMLAAGAKATATVFDEADFKCRAEPETFPVELTERGYFRFAKAGVEFEPPSDPPGPTISMVKQISVGIFSSLGVFKFQTGRRDFAAGAAEAGGDGSVFSISRLLDLSRFKFKVSDDPIPTVALLILVGLVAIIALKGRRR
jgi:hypothetical protein